MPSLKNRDRLPFQVECEANFRRALGDEIFEWLEEQTKDDPPIYPKEEDESP